MRSKTNGTAVSKQPMMHGTLRYATMGSPLGDLLVVASDRGLAALRVAVNQSMPALRRHVTEELGGGPMEEDARGLRALMGQIKEVLRGERPAASIPLDLRGTSFQKRVWEALVRVPWGETCTYSDLARRAGKPRAVRAAASACARNPVAFVIPCHRIIRKNGGLGGYGWGLSMKEQLLARERA